MHPSRTQRMRATSEWLRILTIEALTTCCVLRLLYQMGASCATLTL
jgi:hypothetical protein